MTPNYPLVKPLTLIVAALLSSPIYAQSAESETEEGQLDTIVVTAQRRAERINDVPSAVSVIDTERLAAYGSSGDDILQLSAKSPSLYAESSFGRTFPRFYIRGLGNTDFDLNASQPVSMIYDDVLLENPTLKGFPIFDLDRVEVLRGPQGTLFGRNTPAGVVKFESARPSQVTEGYARLGFGRFSTKNFESAVSGAVTERSSARLSILYQERDGYVDNTRPGGVSLGDFTELAVRGQWLFESGNGFEALFNAHGRRGRGGNAIFQANIIQQGSNQLVPDYRFDRYSQDAPAASFIDTAGANARLSWEMGELRLYSITAYESVEMFARGDVDGGFGASFAPPFGRGFIPFPAESGDGIPSHRQLSQELRLESAIDQALDWQLGALVYDENLNLDNISYNTLAGSTVNGVARQRQDSRSYALFGEAGYLFTPQLRVAAGLRYSDDSKEFVAERLSSPIGAGALAPIRVSPDDQNLSGNINARYTLANDAQLYARFATGYRAPAIQGRLLFGNTVSVADSETVQSFEIGYKADLFDKRARFDFTVFDYTVNDIQLTAVGGAANFNTLINADKTNGRGAELEFEARLGSQFTVNAGFSYNDTELDDKTLAVQPCGSSCTVLDPRGPTAGTVLIDGNPLPQAPKFTGNLSLRYAIPTQTGEFYALSDWSYRTKVNFFLYESREFVGDPLLQGGLRLGYLWNDGGYEVALVGRNILNEFEAVGAVDFNNLTAFINQPRYVGVEFGVRR
jgi:iron complex outermembrane recepter protein